VLNCSLAWTLLAWGQQAIPSGVAGVLNSTSPLFVILLGFLLPKSPAPTVMKLAGLLLGFAGVVMVVGVDALQGLSQSIWSQLAVLAGAVCYAGAALYGKRLAHLSPLVTATGTLLFALPCMLVLSFTLEQPFNLQPSQKALGAALFLGVFCTAVAFILYFRLLQTLGSLGVASQSYLRAGVSVLLGLLILGEQPTATALLGLIAIIVGVACINWPVKKT
jgi:drug/metabolite transporter (DMT)-like permease